MASAKIDKISSKLKKDFSMYATIPVGERWGDMEL